MTTRSGMTQIIWALLWLSWLALLTQQIVDVARFNAPWPMWVLRALPLVLFVPGVARDNLRALIWLCFVILFYFVSAVESVFAQPGDAVAVAGLVSVVSLFIVSVAYLRFRGRELRDLPTEAAQD